MLLYCNVELVIIYVTIVLNVNDMFAIGYCIYKYCYKVYPVYINVIIACTSNYICTE